MNPREQKNHRTSVTTLAKGVEEFAEATAAQFSAVKRQIEEGRTYRLKLAEEQRAYVDGEFRKERTHRQEVDGALSVKVGDFIGRGFWSRLNWLVTGR